MFPPQTHNGFKRITFYLFLIFLFYFITASYLRLLVYKVVNQCAKSIPFCVRHTLTKNSAKRFTHSHWCQARKRTGPAGFSRTARARNLLRELKRVISVSEISLTSSLFLVDRQWLLFVDLCCLVVHYRGIGKRILPDNSQVSV